MQTLLPDVCITRAMSGAYCSTDHHLIRCILKMDVHLTRRRLAAKPKRRLNVPNLHTTTGRSDVCNSMQRAFASSSTTAENSINDDGESFRSTVNTAVGYPRLVNADWFDYNDPAIETLLRDNHAALQKRLRNPQSQAAIQHRAQTNSKLQHELRHMEDSWWDAKADEVQALSDRGDSGGVFQSLNSILGPRRPTSNPMLTTDGNTLLTRKPDILSRWKDY